jgi:hypothetical protein
VVAAAHERFAPAFLRLHGEARFQEGPPRFSIELPITGLSSLSVLPAYATRNRGFPGRTSKIEVLDKFWDGSSAIAWARTVVRSRWRNSPSSSLHTSIANTTACRGLP